MSEHQYPQYPQYSPSVANDLNQNQTVTTHNESPENKSVQEPQFSANATSNTVLNDQTRNESDSGSSSYSDDSDESSGSSESGSEYDSGSYSDSGSGSEMDPAPQAPVLAENSAVVAPQTMPVVQSAPSVSIVQNVPSLTVVPNQNSGSSPTPRKISSNTPKTMEVVANIDPKIEAKPDAKLDDETVRINKLCNLYDSYFHNSLIFQTVKQLASCLSRVGILVDNDSLTKFADLIGTECSKIMSHEVMIDRVREVDLLATSEKVVQTKKVKKAIMDVSSEDVTFIVNHIYRSNKKDPKRYTYRQAVMFNVCVDNGADVLVAFNVDVKKTYSVKRITRNAHKKGAMGNPESMYMDKIFKQKQEPYVPAYDEKTKKMYSNAVMNYNHNVLLYKDALDVVAGVQKVFTTEHKNSKFQVITNLDMRQLSANLVNQTVTNKQFRENNACLNAINIDIETDAKMALKNVRDRINDVVAAANDFDLSATKTYKRTTKSGVKYRQVLTFVIADDELEACTLTVSLNFEKKIEKKAKKEQRYYGEHDYAVERADAPTISETRKEYLRGQGRVPVTSSSTSMPAPATNQVPFSSPFKKKRGFFGRFALFSN